MSHIWFEFWRQKYFLRSPIWKVVRSLSNSMLCTKLHLYSNPVVESWIYICYYIQIWHWPTFRTRQSRWRGWVFHLCALEQFYHWHQDLLQCWLSRVTRVMVSLWSQSQTHKKKSNFADASMPSKNYNFVTKVTFTFKKLFSSSKNLRCLSLKTNLKSFEWKNAS